MKDLANPSAGHLAFGSHKQPVSGKRPVALYSFFVQFRSIASAVLPFRSPDRQESDIPYGVSVFAQIRHRRRAGFGLFHESVYLGPLSSCKSRPPCQDPLLLDSERFQGPVLLNESIRERTGSGPEQIDESAVPVLHFVPLRAFLEDSFPLFTGKASDGSGKHIPLTVLDRTKNTLRAVIRVVGDADGPACRAEPLFQTRYGVTGQGISGPCAAGHLHPDRDLILVQHQSQADGQRSAGFFRGAFP